MSQFELTDYAEMFDEDFRTDIEQNVLPQAESREQAAKLLLPEVIEYLKQKYDDGELDEEHLSEPAKELYENLPEEDIPRNDQKNLLKLLEGLFLREI